MNKEQIRALRFFNQKSQRAFATSIGASPGTIGDIETGRRRITPAFRAKVAAVYDLNADFFEFYEKYLKTAEVPEAR